MIQILTENTKTIFADAAINTNGVLTYYYRFDPEIDITAEDVVIHADHLMYDYKREKKKLKN